MIKTVSVYLYLSLHLAYIIYQNIQSQRKTYAHFTRQELEHRILYRRYTEQFKLHFTDIHNSKIEYKEVR